MLPPVSRAARVLDPRVRRRRSPHGRAMCRRCTRTHSGARDQSVPLSPIGELVPVHAWRAGLIYHGDRPRADRAAPPLALPCHQRRLRCLVGRQASVVRWNHFEQVCGASFVAQERGTGAWHRRVARSVARSLAQERDTRAWHRNVARSVLLCQTPVPPPLASTACSHRTRDALCECARRSTPRLRTTRVLTQRWSS